MKQGWKFSFTAAVLFALLVSLLPAGASPVQALSPDIVISQVYGGGGNTGAIYTHDFVELYNRGTAPVNLGGWSIQYASATGTGNFGASTTQLTELPTVTLQPGQYYLIQEAGGTVGIPLPTPDLVDTTPIAMSATAGKVALVMSPASLGCNGGSTPCSPAQLALIKDLVGYGTANFYEGAAAPAPSNSTAVLRNGGGCTETDNNSSDFSAGAPTPRNTNSALNICPLVDTAPAVTATNPMEGGSVNPDGDLSVTFSEAVSLASAGFTLSCSTSGAHTAAVSGGPTSFSLNPDTNFADGETCTLTILANGVSDLDTNDPPDGLSADFTVSFLSQGVCTLPITPIYDIQGSGAAAAITTPVTTRGVVVGDYEYAGSTSTSSYLRGFYIQDMSGDANPETSDGIFVFHPFSDTVAVGDVVAVTGTPGEFNDQTQISNAAVTPCGTGSVEPVDVTFPVESATFLERYEGMLVRLPQTMFVTEHFQLGRFGQVVISADARLSQPTSIVAPGAPALALQAANNLNKIILDDATNLQNPDPIVFARGGAPLSASNTLRGGDTATGIVGVLNYTWAGNSASGNAYRVRPVNALNGWVNFEPANPRPELPADTGGALKVVGMNLLNYFNTFDGLPDRVDNCTNGLGGSATDCRGADTQAEFDRQWPKTVAAILAINPDVVGVNEIENDGYGADSALQDLVNHLNDATAPGTFAFIDADAWTGQVNALGTDAIKVGMIYKPGMVEPVGAAALNTPAFVNGGDATARSRPALAVSFRQLSNGAVFTVAANHLKSKGSACEIPDAGDGQGNCNVVRTNAAVELANWLASDPTGSGDPDVLIIGDLNSYAMEDPVTVLKNAGYTNLVETFLGPQAYSYVFDGQWGYLDHALANPSMLGYVTGVAEYHINSDEPSVLDYNTDFKTPNLIASLYAPDQYRVSDHDPIIVGLNLNDAPQVDPIAIDPNPAAVGMSVSAMAAFSDPDPMDVHSAVWDWGDGSASPAEVSEAGGYGMAAGSHAYASPGFYTVTLTVTDLFGLSDQEVFEQVVVYDPNGGFITGGGNYKSPVGAYAADPSLGGKVEFSFDAKYLKDSTVPTGSFAFTLNNSILAFASQQFDWLVVAPDQSKAWLKGSGMLNSMEGYQFLMVVEPKPAETLWVKIWYVAEDGSQVVVYDSGAPQKIKGNLVVHK